MLCIQKIFIENVENTVEADGHEDTHGEQQDSMNVSERDWEIEQEMMVYVYVCMPCYAKEENNEIKFELDLFSESFVFEACVCVYEMLKWVRELVCGIEYHKQINRKPTDTIQQYI